jgi:hypothetical protein
MNGVSLTRGTRVYHKPLLHNIHYHFPAHLLREVEVLLSRPIILVHRALHVLLKQKCCDTNQSATS